MTGEDIYGSQCKHINMGGIKNYRVSVGRRNNRNYYKKSLKTIGI